MATDFSGLPWSSRLVLADPDATNGRRVLLLAVRDLVQRGHWELRGDAHFAPTAAPPPAEEPLRTVDELLRQAPGGRRRHRDEHEPEALGDWLGQRPVESLAAPLRVTLEALCSDGLLVRGEEIQRGEWRGWQWSRSDAGAGLDARLPPPPDLGREALGLALRRFGQALDDALRRTNTTHAGSPYRDPPNGDNRSAAISYGAPG